jgi:hypothetical protein
MSPSSSDASARSGSVEATGASTISSSTTGVEISVALAARAASNASALIPYPNTQKTIFVRTRSKRDTTAMMNDTNTRTTAVYVVN